MTGTLRQAAVGYLQTRRSLGYQLQAHDRLLISYIADLEASGQATVTAVRPPAQHQHLPGAVGSQKVQTVEGIQGRVAKVWGPVHLE